MVQFNTGLVLLAVTGSGLAVADLAATTYRAVDITVRATQSEGQLSASATASPVLGIKAPTVKNGVAFVGLSRTQTTYSAVLGTKFPTNLHLDLSQGTLQGSLAGVPLSALSIKTFQTELSLVLPAVNLAASLEANQGEVALQVPAAVGVQFNLKNWKQGSLTINGQKVVDAQDARGSYATPNFSTAKFRIRFDVAGDSTDLTLTQQ